VKYLKEHKDFDFDEDDFDFEEIDKPTIYIVTSKIPKRIRWIQKNFYAVTDFDDDFVTLLDNYLRVTKKAIIPIKKEDEIDIKNGSSKIIINIASNEFGYYSEMKHKYDIVFVTNLDMLKENIQEDWVDDETPDDYSILDNLERLPIEYKKYNDLGDEGADIDALSIETDYIHISQNIEEYYIKQLKIKFKEQGKDKTIELYNNIRTQFDKDKFYGSADTIMFDITEFTRNLIT